MSTDISQGISTITIRPITALDAKSVAQAHCSIFPGYFLTRIGPKALECFYREFAENPEAFCLVADDRSEIVGLVAGVLNSPRFYRSFYQKNFGNLFLWVTASVMRDPSLVSELLKRAAHFFFAIRSRLKIRGENHEFSKISSVPYRLLSIGIMPSARGKGIGEQLVESLALKFAQCGCKKMGLSVFKNNKRAIAFYEKTGWEREFCTESSIYYVKSLREILK